MSIKESSDSLDLGMFIIVPLKLYTKILALIGYNIKRVATL